MSCSASDRSGPARIDCSHPAQTRTVHVLLELCSRPARTLFTSCSNSVHVLLKLCSRPAQTLTVHVLLKLGYFTPMLKLGLFILMLKLCSCPAQTRTVHVLLNSVHLLIKLGLFTSCSNSAHVLLKLGLFTSCSNSDCSLSCSDSDCSRPAQLC